MKKPDTQTELLQTVWRKAFLNGEVQLRLPTKSDLTNLRFKLYNISKQIKKGKQGEDMDLENAVENCSIRTEEKDGVFFLTVYRKDKSLLLQSIASQLGVEMNVPPTAGQMTDDAAGALSRIMGQLTQE